MFINLIYTVSSPFTLLQLELPQFRGKDELILVFVGSFKIAICDILVFLSGFILCLVRCFIGCTAHANKYSMNWALIRLSQPWGSGDLFVLSCTKRVRKK